MKLIKYNDNFGRIYYVTSDKMLHNYISGRDGIHTIYRQHEIEISKDTLKIEFKRISRGIYQKVDYIIKEKD